MLLPHAGTRREGSVRQAVSSPLRFEVSVT